MEVPKNFALEDDREKLFKEMLEKNYKRKAKLESIEDLVLKDIPEEIKQKSYGKVMQPRYAKDFNDIDKELDYLNIGLDELPELDWIEQVHVTNIDVGFYKLDILVIESECEDSLRYYYEGIFNYVQDMNKGKYDIIKHLIKDKYLIFLFAPDDRLRLFPVLLNKVYDYYKNKFDMKSIDVRKVIELI